MTPQTFPKHLLYNSNCEIEVLRKEKEFQCSKYQNEKYQANRSKPEFILEASETDTDMSATYAMDDNNRSWPHVS